MTNIKELVASNIKRYRNAAGLSQEKFAEKADTSGNYIAEIETGRRFPSVEMLEKLAIAAEIDPIDFFSLNTAQNNIQNCDAGKNPATSPKYTATDKPK
jgi:transcriptional regulator with XRE-family HTH domain